ncbi:tellurium resistance protein TerC [Empedobacter falsenii]
MRKIAPFIQTFICYLFIILFIYAAVSKLMDFENFQIQLAQSPLLSAYAGFISYAVIIVEIVIVLLLCIKRTQQIGLYASYGLMLAFTVYIYLIINYSDFVPCSCGGILEKLGWTEHLIFNIIFVGLAVIAIYLEESAIYQKIKRKLFVTFFAISIVSIGSVIILFLTSEHIIKQENNFTRRYLQHPIIEEKAIDLGANSYYFAGFENNTLYLGNHTSPLIITSIDRDLTKIDMQAIKLDQLDFNFRSISLKVFQDEFYIYDGSVPVIFKGRLPNYHAKLISLGTAYFSQLIPLGNNHFAMRTHSNKLNYQVLGLIHLDTDEVKLKNNILEKQIDGVFDIDGQLNHDPINKKIIYNYYYRNQFIVMNENLEIQHRLSTIDTIQKVHIKLTTLKDGTKKMSAPPLLVNKNMNTYQNILFNESNLMGKYESQQLWKQASVIDMYQTDRNHYIGIFYVHHRQNKKISNFLVTDTHFYALIGNELVGYRMAPTVTKQFKIE